MSVCRPVGKQRGALRVEEVRVDLGLVFEYIEADARDFAGLHGTDKCLLVDDWKRKIEMRRRVKQIEIDMRYGPEPRAVLMMNTPSFIWANCASESRW